MKNTLLPILAVGLASLAAAQYGPAPPRINIPGAIPLPVVRGVPIREERVLPPQTQVLRVRRPGGAPSSIRPPPQHQQSIPIQFSTPKFFESEAKPVTEEHEEPQHQNSAPFLPIIHSSPAPPPALPSLPQQHSIPDELDDREIQQNILSRFNSQDNIGRPAPIPRAQIPERFFSTEKELSSNAQRFNIPSNAAPAPVERPAPVPAPKQYRPAPQQVVQQRPRVQQQAQHFDEDRPHRQQQEDDRRKKPVAQILRKWREEHEDGSITWGFENDDGSFKEETIGIDCVTRGSYGYVDPDGEKREYTYETGILCDPNKRDEEDEEELEDELQLKNKLKRPNQPQQQGQQQQYYRN